MHIKRLYNTLKYLKLKQVYYRIFYRLRNGLRKKTDFRYNYFLESDSTLLNFDKMIPKYSSYAKKNGFIFLNKRKTFRNKIDWNFKNYGKLWTYNLNYFDFLNQKDLSKEEGLRLIYNFINNIGSIKDGLEPYPISLRGINWIKFLSKNDINDKKINDSLYAQYYMLLDNLEYHLLGNHLLENGFSLLFGAYYFKDKILYQRAKEILISELNEQILSDGGHFELSPMYHQILLDRLLDCINLVKNNNWKNYELLEFLEEKAKLMLSWLENITFSNGNIPLFNDSAFNIAPDTRELVEYAKRLEIRPHSVPLGESGYRVFKKKNYEMAIDVCDVKASYIPGHTHADTFTFELYVKNKPVIVDTGISTYENNERRFLERSTKSHNTVGIEGKNSSEVWGSFRVGERAKIVDLFEEKDFIRAIHDGYLKKFGALHKREIFFKENEITVSDKILKNKNVKAKFYLHFHPDAKINIEDGKIIVNKRIIIQTNKKKFDFKEYYYAPEFNKLMKAKVLEVSFIGELSCKIKIKN